MRPQAARQTKPRESKTEATMHKAALDRSAGGAVQIVAEAASAQTALSSSVLVLVLLILISDAISAGARGQDARKSGECAAHRRVPALTRLFNALNFSLHNSKCSLLPKAKRTEKSSSHMAPGYWPGGRAGTLERLEMAAQESRHHAGAARAASRALRTRSAAAFCSPATSSRSPSRRISSI